MARATPARTIDVSGLKCPLPVVRASKELAAMKRGERLVVIATDPGSVPDMKGWEEADPRVRVESQEKREEGGTIVFVHTLSRR